MVLKIFFLGAILSSGEGAQANMSYSDGFTGFQGGHYGYGLLLGHPTGIRYQRWTDWDRALSFDLGYQFDEFVVASSQYHFYLLNKRDRWHTRNRVGAILKSLSVGATVGGYVGDEDKDTQFGVKAGGAFEYLMPNSSWSMKVELTPVLYLSGDTAGGVQGAIAFTYYINGQTGRGIRAAYSKEESNKKRRKRMKRRRSR